MRFRMGKGQVLVFDAFVEKKLEELKTKKGFYPTLKEIGEQCVPVQPAPYIHRSLVRLAQAGRLSKEAMQVYNSKKHNTQGEADHGKTTTDQKTNQKAKSGKAVKK